MNPLLAERSDIQRRKTIMTHHSRESFVPQSSAQVWSLGEEGENKLLFRLERERERKDRGREGQHMEVTAWVHNCRRIGFYFFARGGDGGVGQHFFHAVGRDACSRSRSRGGLI